MKQYLSRRRVVWYLLLYFLVIFYTVTFSTTVSWFLFYAFTLLLVLSYMSSRSTISVQDVSWSITNTNHMHVRVKLSSKRWLPFAWSSLTLTLSKDHQSRTHSQSALFSRTVKTTFQPIYLNRGHHDSLMLEVEGTSLFGMWSTWTTLQIPVDVDIYPALLTKTQRGTLMKEISPLLSSAPFSSIHEFYVKEIRGFQDRDSMSDIDWKSSMRRGQWMVKEYEREEESPLDLFFCGFDTEDFEFLLSVTYNLYLELRSSKPVDLFLLGQFDDSLASGQSDKSFLKIQPTSNDQALSRLLKESLNSDRRSLIITSDSRFLSVKTGSDSARVILDAWRLHYLKGD